MELKIGKADSDEAPKTPQAPKPRKQRVAKASERACSGCGRPMKRLRGSTSAGLDYTYFKCAGCGEEMASTEQLHEIAAKSRALKTYNAKITRWGQSLGIRIPKELAAAHDMTHNEEVTIVPEESGFRILPATKK